jgi:hypothetical protein
MLGVKLFFILLGVAHQKNTVVGRALRCYLFFYFFATLLLFTKATNYWAKKIEKKDIRCNP